MGAFYVNCCIRGLDQNEVLALMRQNPVPGFVGPTLDGWTALVAEDLEMQDPRTIEGYGRRLTQGSDRVAMTFLCHDEDVLLVWLFRGGKTVGHFDSCPAYFEGPGEFDPETMTFSKPSPPSDQFKPRLEGEQAFADAFGLDVTGVHGLMDDSGPLELHERWAATLGLPA